MRTVSALCVIVLLVSPALASLANSEVVLVEPAEPIPVGPPAAIDFVFLVQNDPASTEVICVIWIDFREGLEPQDGTLWYDEIGPGWPVFECGAQFSMASWFGGFDDTNGIPVGEATHIGVLVVPYSGFPSGSTELTWRLLGSSGTWESGWITLYTTPVECNSWGRVKALYRD